MTIQLLAPKCAPAYNNKDSRPTHLIPVDEAAGSQAQLDDEDQAQEDGELKGRRQTKL